MEPKKFASILTEKLEKIKQDRDIEEKWDNKMIKNLSEVYLLLNKKRCLVYSFSI